MSGAAYEWAARARPGAGADRRLARLRRRGRRAPGRARLRRVRRRRRPRRPRTRRRLQAQAQLRPRPHARGAASRAPSGSPRAPRTPACRGRCSPTSASCEIKQAQVQDALRRLGGLRGLRGRADRAGARPVALPQQARVLLRPRPRHRRARLRLPRPRRLEPGAADRGLPAGLRGGNHARRVAARWCREQGLRAWSRGGEEGGGLGDSPPGAGTESASEGHGGRLRREQRRCVRGGVARPGEGRRAELAGGPGGGAASACRRLDRAGGQDRAGPRRPRAAAQPRGARGPAH